ncbi:hypothetical protein, partial [Ralstonia solanacearum species complex bacterium KE055]|uniref:hypothetical protein n=1 Tax=Ralstonia solanacearum species complex bacterium KE055 TaxID=3119586 RepID=UPI002FC35073
QHHPAQEGETHRQTTRTKRHLTAFGVGQFSMQILGQDSVQINTVGSVSLTGLPFTYAYLPLF